jgi:hypothetical protein
MCVDEQGATSEATRLMTTHRPECWGHYIPLPIVETKIWDF